MGATVRRAGALALLLMAASGAAFEPKKSKTRVSANGVFGIRLVELSETACRVEAVKEQDLAWSLERCPGRADDLYFISDDGQRFWVLFPLPEIPDAPSGRTRRRASKHPPMLDAVVAVEYDARGTLLATKHLADFMSEKTLDEVRPLKKHFKWLNGMLSVPGSPPRLNEAGQIEFETVASKVYNLKF